MNKLKTNSGFVMIVFLALLLMLALIGINSVMTSSMEVDIAGNEINHLNSFYAAEAALEMATAELLQSFEQTGHAPASLPSGILNLGRYSVKYRTTQTAAAANVTLSKGALSGLFANVTPYEVSAVASAGGTEAEAALVQVVQAQMIPLYQFAVFYENDLEIGPGRPMTINGRVHTNGDIYLESSNGLNIDSYTTSAGDLFHGTKPGSGQTTGSGDIQVMDDYGNYVDMYQDGYWLDSTDPDWVSESISRWGGRVEDQSHGSSNLDMSVAGSGVPENMIATAAESSESYENEADLKIIDGVALHRQVDGSWIDVTANLQAEGSVTVSSFYDAHQGEWVAAYDVDMSVFKSSSYFPTNGIMYTAVTGVGGMLPATRIKNGADIGSPFTVASKNSVYVQGDYNTVNKQPSSIMADALTILSNSWNDANGSDPLSMRMASGTTVNCAYMTGNQNTGEGGSAYNGGLENLPRFLENWTNVDFNWTGSAIDLWLSQEASAAWSYGTYYTAPNRNWSFDTDFNDPTKLPPGTPMIATVQKVSWRETVVASN